MERFNYDCVYQISYVILFGNFFYQSYVRGGGKKYNQEKQQQSKVAVANGHATSAMQQNGGLKTE